jgi:demethylmenaquinone methyltransferase/2-methoxy-6-polyprenyl-1,4-benzoquinol methylase
MASFSCQIDPVGIADEMLPTMQREVLPGTRPEGARDEREAGLRVREMFARIAPRYDFLNHLLSFSMDRVWRHRTAKLFSETLVRADALALDLCCGTGDLAFALARRRARLLGGRKNRAAQVIGSDFVEGMLVRARAKAIAGGYQVSFAGADALALPFNDESVDLVTSAFGFRNLSNYEHGLREFARLLKPGGEIGILEFSEPEHGWVARVFRFYFKQVLPRIGGAISGDKQAYAYLPGSVAKFPSARELSALLERCGFIDVRVHSWNFGSVLLHRAKKGVEPLATGETGSQCPNRKVPDEAKNDERKQFPRRG